MNYNGRDKAGQEKNAGTNWLIYTLGMGVLPLIIKFLIGSFVLVKISVTIEYI